MISEDHSSEKAAKARVIDACAQASRLKGFSDAVGVLRGTLLMSPDPVSMDDLVEATGYSKSTVSSNMSFLENLGVAHRVVSPGDKKYRYVAVIDPDTLRSAMIKQIDQEVHLLLGAMDQAEKDLGVEAHATLKDRIKTIRECYSRIERLLALMSLHNIEELIEILERSPGPATL